MKTTPTRPSASFLKQYWYVLLLGIAFILLIIANILRVLTPPESGVNVWNGVKPGKSKANKLEELGAPILTEQKNGDTYYYYKSEFPTVPTEVIVDKNNTVQFIKERISYDPKHTLNTYTDQLGAPDLELFYTPSRGVLKAYVFLKHGLVILSHQQDLSVEQRWYFAPTDKDTFLTAWGEELGETEGEPGEPVISPTQ